MRLLILVALAALIAGCKAPPRGMDAMGEPSFDAPDCKGSGLGSNDADCNILVNVSVAGSTCTVDVQADQDVVKFARGASDKWIVWQIDRNPGGFRFTSQGIAFKSDPRRNFKNSKVINAGLGFRWKNSNGSHDVGEYPYTIKVENKAGVRCERDPKIINE
jgi:hypothetical protein